MLKDILSRGFFIRLSAITSLIFYLFFILALQQRWASLPENLFIRFLVFSSVPFLLISLYFTSYRRVFPQRFGDCLQALVAILMVIAGNALFTGELSISGPFFIGFVLLIPFFLLLLDDFLPIFIGGCISLLLIIEFLLIEETAVSFYPFLDLSLNLLAIFITTLVSSSFVKRVLLEQATRKELQKAYKELKKLDVAKTEFISIASHQLRTPLAIIKSSVSMVAEGVYGKIPQKAKKRIETIYRSNERLIKLVDDLLSISRIETGKMEMNLETVFLEEIIASVVDELKPKAREKGLYLRWKKAERPMQKILVDKEKVRQVLLNVIDNAIKYTKKGGVTVELARDNASLLTTVADTGVGLTGKELAYLFESFSRGKAGIQLWPEGIGLGLYITRRLVELHHGKIWAESKGKGKGSTFFIKLPAK